MASDAAKGEPISTGPLETAPTSSDGVGSRATGRPPEASPSGTPPNLRPTPSLDSAAVPTGSSPPGSFGKYQLLEEVATGGMGVVYKARDTMLDRIVALKVIRGGNLARGDKVMRFLREAKAVAQFDHPHIVPILEIDILAGQHYFTMPFAAGGNLDKNLGRFLADRKKAVALMEKIARAVECMHTKGILHRDLKPSNILLDENAEPMVGDFGLAKFLHVDMDLTQTDQMMGTPAYMAPEQAAGHHDRVKPQTEIWALGVILYQLLTGKRPFAGKSREILTAQILHAEPPAPRSVRADLDQGLECIILKCLEKDPKQRFASAEALAEELARWLRGEPGRLARPGLARRVRRWIQRHRVTSLAGVFLAGAVLVVAAFLFFSDPDRRLQTIYREITENKQALLIKDAGPPRWSRLIVGEADARVSQISNVPFTFETWGHYCLLELLPDPHLTRYRFSAEVHHQEGTDFSEVGIFFGCRKQFTPQGRQVYEFYKLAFHDFVTIAGRDPRGKLDQSQAHLNYHFRWTKEDGDPIERIESTGIVENFTPAGRQKWQTWRKLAVNVTPDGIECFWEGKSLGSVRREQLENIAGEAQSRKPGPPVDPLGFSPSGSLGLYVSKGSAWFQSVAIVSLDALPAR